MLDYNNKYFINIIILHLILKNLDSFNLYERLEGDDVKKELVNIEKKIEGSIESVLNTNNNLRYTDININTNNIIPKSAKKILLGSDKINLEPSMSLNVNNNSLYGNQCTYGGIVETSNLRSSVNFDASNSQPIDQCYQNYFDKYYQQQDLPHVNEPGREAPVLTNFITTK